MSLLTALARVDAVAAGRAQRIATCRHVWLSPTPLVMIPFGLAGETAAPLALMLGIDRAAPRVLTVPQPRDRDLLARFFDQLAVEIQELAGDEPQVIVPNRAGVEFLRLLGRATRFRPGDWVGRWLTFVTERADQPGSSTMIAATTGLTQHWATGQSAVEDANLGTVLGWIIGAPDPAVELLTAGPDTDPEFDNRVLGPLMAAYDRGAPDAAAAIAEELRAQLAPIWAQMWHAIDLLAELPAAPSVAERWLWDIAAYAAFVAQPEAPPAPRRDNAAAAAARLDRLERAQARFDAQRAFDDPLVMAGHLLSGQAFRCTVLATEPDRREGRKLRPRITVRAMAPVQLRGTVTSPSRRNQTAEITTVDGTDLVLTLTSGMGRGGSPAAGSVPEIGEQLVYAALSEAFHRPAAFPEQTPWTHGG